MTTGKVLFITGIDTDIGKTVVTGLIARFFLQKGVNVITQKMIQTGCVGLSEDIIRHRELMGTGILPEDHDGVTCPYVFPVSCSPHLAARLENRVIDCGVIRQATTTLLEKFNLVLLEGAGGLSVPLHDDFTVLDYLETEKFPVILVSSSRLGSINHTLNALEIAQKRGLNVAAIIYNRFNDTDPRISRDSKEIFSKYLVKHGFRDCVIDFPAITEGNNDEYPIDFSSLLT